MDLYVRQWKSAVAVWAVMVEAQTVIALRLKGMAGLRPASPRETTTMVIEKAPAFAEAAVAASVAAMQGKAPDQVAAAAIRPIKRRTGANVKRLAKPRTKPAT